MLANPWKKIQRKCLYFQIYENILLPRLNIEDFLIFENMGAYFLALATQFNGLPLPIVEYYIDRKYWNLLNYNSTSLYFEKNESSEDDESYSNVFIGRDKIITLDHS